MSIKRFAYRTRSRVAAGYFLRPAFRRRTCLRKRVLKEVKKKFQVLMLYQDLGFT